MSWKRFSIFGLLAVAIPTLAGCRLGATADRNIQVGRHVDSDNSFALVPETRLSRMLASDAEAAGRSDVQAHLSDYGEAGRSEVHVSLSDDHTVDLSSTEAQLMQAAGLAEADMQDLLAAFRDSPPEVRQQAVRQLIAAASVRAGRTQAPVDINQRLSALLDSQDLPALPDVIEDSAEMPVRLGQSLPAVAAQAPVTMPDPERQPAADGQPVAAVAMVSSSTDAIPRMTLPPLAMSGNAEPISAIDPAEVAAMAATEPVPATIPPAASQAAPATPLTEQELYRRLLETLSVASAGESDGDRLRRELARRYLLVLTGDPDSAVQTLEGLSKNEQEFLRYHLLALWNLTDSEAHPVASRRLGAALPNYSTAIGHLRQAAEQLEVRSLAFCTEIVSYGQVKRFPNAPLAAGQKVILYCEIDNFVAEKTAAGYVTELQGSYEIFNSDGIKVAGQVLPTDHQACDHFLRDYFIAYQMSLPAQLSPGKYRLELTMECGKGKKYGQASLPLEIR